MTDWQLKIFISFCASCACFGYVNLTAQQLICLCVECLVVAEYYHYDDYPIQEMLNVFLGELYQEAKKFNSQERGDKESERNAYFWLGKTYWLQNKLEEARKWFKKCLSDFPLPDDKEMEKSVYGGLSTIYLSLGKYEKATIYYEKLLYLIINNNDGETMLLYKNLAQAYKSLGKFDEAIEYYTKQLALAETMDCKEEIKSAHFNLGAIYIGYPMARKTFKTIKHFEKLLAISMHTGDERMQKSACHLLGCCFLSESNYSKAIEYYEKASNIALETDITADEMEMYIGMGCAYFALGKYLKAIANYEKALSIAKELDDKNKKGFLYLSLAGLFESLGDFDKAREYCLESLSIAKDTGDKELEMRCHGCLGKIKIQLGKCHESLQFSEKMLDLQGEVELVGDQQSTLYANMGNVYRMIGNNDTALKYFQMYLHSCQKTGNKVWEGSAYSSISAIYAEQGKYQDAMDCSKKSLAIARELGDEIGEVDSLLYLGGVYSLQDKYEEALECLESSLVIAKKIGYKKKEQGIYQELGQLHAKCGKYEKAMYFNAKALKLAVSSGDKYGEVQISFNMGLYFYVTAGIFKEVHLVNECMNECKNYLEQSLQCFEWIFDHLHDRDDFKITIMEDFISVYKLLTSVRIETGENEEALIVSDHGRARALSDLMKLKYSEIPQNGKNAIQKYDDVDSVLYPRKNEFCVLYFALHLHNVYFWALAHRRPLVFQEKDAQVFEQTQIPTSQKSEIISVVALAAYDHMNVRSIQNCEDRSLDHLPENTSESEVSFLSTEYQKEGKGRKSEQDQQQLLQKTAQDGEKNAEGNTNPLEMLYTELIAPVMHGLVHEELVIVPDGPLFMIPFAALRDPETGLFLSEMKRIRLVPSLTTLKFLKECPGDYHSKSGALVVGGPDSGTVIFQGKETTFSPLPEAQHEATLIGNILGVTPLLGAQATKDVIKQRLHEGVAIIHFAAHGSPKGEIVLAPCTLAGESKIPEEEDYMLTMQEVQKIGMRAQLVVLSCCHSGRGDIRAEGIVGISRGFLAAGARAVVASLWAIDDDITLEFIASFYLCLKRGESASKSLQQAMKDVRDDYKETRHWAPFFLIGDDVTINL